MKQKNLNKLFKKALVNLAVEEIKRNASKIRLTQLFNILEGKHGLECRINNSKHGAIIYFGLISDSRVVSTKEGNKRFFEVV